MQIQVVHHRSRQWLCWFHLSWLSSGVVLLVSSPLPEWTPDWGWTPLYGWVIAPASSLLALTLSAYKPLRGMRA